MTAASHFFINGSAHTQEDFVRSACDPKRSVVVEDRKSTRLNSSH